ncbi:hypothetical protein SCHPADRAFT_933629 [Schizopora paradoxa]|uniref:Uncharacterized protein n=1 Tax=Schizopora paradoxa TaxID=27342 RepID=A0A0H2R7L2_9AGAM|nr:hypothetical protein SCHPADRAFT_933629 [Schizopora paradoxa]
MDRIHRSSHRSPDEVTSSTAANTGSRVMDSDNLQPNVDTASSLPAEEVRRSLADRLEAGFGTLLTRTAPDRFLSPGIVANEIRRICRHDQTTFAQRHKDGGSFVHISEQINLESLCLRLLLFSRTGTGSSVQRSNIAYKEFIDLSIGDPLLRTIFQVLILKREEHTAASLDIEYLGQKDEMGN